MRFIHSTAVAVVGVALVGAVTLVGPAGARPVPATGGCYGGGQFTAVIGPGPGSRTVTSAPLSSCTSPLLPGIMGGVLTLSVPWNLFGGVFPATGGIAWSNGKHSTLSGTVNSGSDFNTLAITRGPGAGHHLVVKSAEGGTTRLPISNLTSAVFAP